ncbi:MAG: transposase [Pseudomonadota bacterium]
MFQYHPARSGDVASKFLNGYQGIVQTDGYAGYNFLDAITGIISRRPLQGKTKKSCAHPQ